MGRRTEGQPFAEVLGDDRMERVKKDFRPSLRRRIEKAQYGLRARRFNGNGNGK